MAIRRAGVLLLLLALAGCGGEEGERVDGSGYSYAVPDGWEEQAGDELEVGGFRPDSLVMGEREDDFTTNVNVIREGGVPAGVTAAHYADVSLAGLRDPAAAGLPPELAETIEGLRPRQISEPRDAELDGEDAVAWAYRSTQGERDVRVRQVAAVVDGAGYTVTLTALPEQLDEGGDALDELLQTWSWE